MYKLILNYATIELLWNNIERLAANPCLLPNFECTRLHGNKINASACKEFINGDLIQPLLSN
jgi:hypothetical protein